MILLNMIEVEKKFTLTRDQEERLLEGAKLFKEVTNIDVFFDTQNYHYTLQDMWLRTRNGAFELKIGQGKNRTRNGTVYEEIEEEARIRKKLQLLPNLSMNDALIQAGILPFATIHKTRRSYKREGFRIDIDVCDFGYELAEIELLVEHASDVQEALDRIQALANHLGLDASPQRGKLIEYLYRFSPNHYKALLEAGAIDL
ncbi:hypothetical protein COV05_00720 [Candidatus Uhrbacteria bacterium CG10_big_fil_rev_8_21_14_0_10_48_16]|uniref:CYTH domain-containing protein n=1 Tax=Candidatus Uhrbacteria bacterium CG10_big_fil_rev_8_21_14_0_10_48_16 TaxID=1975038 RepID=A0A2M8LI48_9BACT|nr:MAG: hypothetical protein COV05_00720 [Candidatus Uhrbacteria bacterium CG10_big_fil_rev_8_21_14_0_10_48_16]